jgi:hypothetical protein
MIIIIFKRIKRLEIYLFNFKELNCCFKKYKLFV